MIIEAMHKINYKGVVTLEQYKSSKNNLYVVEGMYFDCGYILPYFFIHLKKTLV
jgi:chaperonin GroEL